MYSSSPARTLLAFGPGREVLIFGPCREVLIFGPSNFVSSSMDAVFAGMESSWNQFLFFWSTVVTTTHLIGTTGKARVHSCGIGAEVFRSQLRKDEEDLIATEKAGSQLGRQHCQISPRAHKHVQPADGQVRVWVLEHWPFYYIRHKRSASENRRSKGYLRPMTYTAGLIWVYGPILEHLWRGISRKGFKFHCSRF